MTAEDTVLNDFIDKHPFAAAKSLEHLESEEVAGFFQSISLENSTKLFGLLHSRKAADILIHLTDDKAKQFIENVDVSFIASVTKVIDEPKRTKLLNKVSSTKQALIKRQLSFLSNTVAAAMEVAVVINKQMSITDVIAIIKKHDKIEVIYLYVVDSEGIFTGIIRLRELLLADSSDVLENLIIKHVPSFQTNISIKSILDHAAWTEFQEVPILDISGKLIGKLPHRNIYKFSNKPNPNPNNDMALAGSALGELYRIGLNGLLQGGSK